MNGWMMETLRYTNSRSSSSAILYSLSYCHTVVLQSPLVITVHHAGGNVAGQLVSLGPELATRLLGFGVSNLPPALGASHARPVDYTIPTSTTVQSLKAGKLLAGRQVAVISLLRRGLTVRSLGRQGARQDTICLCGGGNRGRTDWRPVGGVRPNQTNEMGWAGVKTQRELPAVSNWCVTRTDTMILAGSGKLRRPRFLDPTYDHSMAHLSHWKMNDLKDQNVDTTGAGRCTMYEQH